MMSPMNPSSEPQIERDRRIMAGLSPMAFPITLGVSTRSCMH